MKNKTIGIDNASYAKLVKIKLELDESGIKRSICTIASKILLDGKYKG